MAGRKEKQQGAVEFITTYGWAIIAVVVALGVLYSLGIFNFSSNGSTGCIVIAGFSCSKPVLFSSGALTMGLGQIGGVKTITAVGCSQSSSSPKSWKTANVLLQSGQITNLTFSCTGVQSSLGALYQGTLWINYTTSSGQSVTQQIGSIRTAVQESGLPGIPSGNSYVPITVTNGQGSATGPNFQQMVNVTASAYSQYEATNLGNIRFYQGSTELYSWCESGCNSGSGKAVFWIDIPGGIAANSNTTLYMVLENSITVGYDTNYAGECPSCSGNYAQYDNGANVFSYYLNFAGTATPSGWTGSGNVIISNGLTLTSPSTGHYGQSSYLWETSFSSGPWLGNPDIFETYASFSYTGNVMQIATTGYGGVNESTAANIGIGLYYNGGGAYAVTSSSTGPEAFSVQPSGGMHIWSDINTGSLTGEYDYGNPLTISNYGPYVYGELQIEAGVNPGGIASIQGTAKTVAQWLRIRAYPPGGVMPSYSFGVVGST
jgi:hypothetical protein